MEDSINVDLDHMISLIEMRPMLWDKTSEDYKSRHLKTAAWHEICVILIDNFETLTLHEQNEKGRTLIKKWTNEREKWMKWRRRHESSNSVKKPPYNDQLGFLEKIFEPSNTLSLETIDTETDQDDSKPSRSNEYETEFVSTSCRSESSQRFRASKKRRTSDEYEVDLNSVKPTPTPPPAFSAEIPMLSFFRGILPALEDFDADENLQFQIQVLSLIQTIKREKKRKFENF